VDRCQNGVLWAFPNVTATSWRPQYSSDNGATWTQDTAQSGVTNASVFIDLDDYCHVVWTQSGSTGPNGASLNDGDLLYMRGTPNAGRTAWTWSAATVFGSASNGFDYPDVVAHREGTGWAAHIVFSRATSFPSNYVYYSKVAITSAGVITQDTATFISANYGINAHTYPTIDFQHTGDGKTVAGGTPHLYVGWTAGTTGAGKGIRFRKAVYSAGAWTWNAEREIDNTRYQQSTVDWLNCIFDGARVLITGLGYTAASARDIILHERDAADTTTTTRTLLAGAAGTDFLSTGSATYDGSANVYLFGRDNTGGSGTYKINYRKWTRATATLGAIVTLDATGPDLPYISAKRGYSNSRIEIIRTDGTTSPYNVVYDSITVEPLRPYVPAMMP